MRPAIQVVPIYCRAGKVADMNSDGASTVGITYPGGEFAGVVNWRNLIDAMEIDRALAKRSHVVRKRTSLQACRSEI